jgi:hypothetical protein
MKVVSSIGRMFSKPNYLNKIEDSEILCVQIKFIDIQKNTKSEGNFMGFPYINTKNKGNFMGFY